MNTATGPPWSQPPQINNDMAAMGDQDFNSFVDLDLGDIDDLNIPIFDANGQNTSSFVQGADAQHHQHGSRPGTSDALDQPANLFHANMHLAFGRRQDHNFSLPQGHPPTSQPIVPPTPNSAEVQSEAASRFLNQLDPQMRSQWIEQQYHQMRKTELVRASNAPNNPIPMSGQASFTPLASPAVTPHDRRFHMQQQEYSVQPGAYFSPLTSPALEGDIQPYQNNTSASSVATSSPVDPNVDMLGEAALPPPTTAGSRRRKRPNITRSASSGGRLKQSPIAKPQQQRRKANLSSVVPSKSVQQLVDQAQKPHLSPTSPTGPQRPYSQTSSSTSSISPEPISEAIMGPPPKPASAQASPAIHAESRSNSSSSLPAQGQVPATPASLLQTHQASRGSGTLSGHELPISPNSTVMEELNLPEPAAARPALGRIVTALPDSGDDTPTMSARKTPKLGPLSTPGSSTNLQSKTRPAPIANTVTSPTTSVMSPAGSQRKAEVKGGRGSKKRASISSSNTLVSPALRPKISPSIRPMISSGGDGTHSMDEAMQTHFLTQRSNYQNLIEGTHVPGVNYPSELSTNLTSKRTSHKIAEQGRRNRINLALQEMQSLLPTKSGTGAQPNGSASSNATVVKFDEGDDDDDGVAEGNGKPGTGKTVNGFGGNTALGKQGGNSKAATVESAIEYIKYMQSQQRTWHEERSVWNQQIEEKDGEIEELRRRLDEMERRFGERCGGPVGEASLDGMTEAGEE